jgi:competence protein CoiA
MVTEALHKITGKLVKIETAIRGNNCDCICSICGEPLQARKGPQRDHHFKHINSENCAGETLLHKLAKEILPAHNQILLPDGKGWFEYTRVEIEQRVKGFISDVILYSKSGGKLYVEIAVTSFIQATKHSKIVKSEINTIEINLSDFCRNASWEQLAQVVIHEHDRKQIVYWNFPNPIQQPSGKPYSFPWGKIILFFLVIFGLNRLLKVVGSNRKRRRR